MKQETFSIRKTKLGAVSVAIAAALLFPTGAQADEVTTAAADEVVTTASPEEPVAEPSLDEQVESTGQDLAAAEIQLVTTAAALELADTATKEAEAVKEQAATAKENQLEALTTAEENLKTSLATESKAQQAASQKAEEVTKTADQIATKRADLEQAVKDATKTVTEQTVVKSYSHAANSDQNRRNKEWLEQVTYNGEEEVVIELTNDQKAILEIEGYVPYEPNADRITELMAQYINEIRELNGIEGRVFAGDASMRGFINDRLVEMTELAEKNGGFYILSHTSNLRDTYDASVTPDANGDVRTTKFSGENLNTYIYNDDNVAQRRPWSDEELAYNMTLDWFNDYENIVNGTNPTDGQKPVAEAVHKAREVGIENLTDAEQKLLAKMYGHNYMITTARGAISFGATYETNVYNYVGTSAGSRFRAVLHGFQTDEENIDSYYYKNEHLSVILNDEGKLGLRHDGEVITFLPKRTFTYVTTTEREVTEPSALQALTDYLDSTKDTVTNLQAEADRLAAASLEATKNRQAAEQERDQLLAQEPALTQALEAATAKADQATTTYQQAKSDYDQVLERRDQLQERYDQLLAEQTQARLQASYDQIVADGGTPVPVLDETGAVVDYQALEVEVETGGQVTNTDEGVSAIPDHAPETEALPDYVFDPADFPVQPEPEKGQEEQAGTGSETETPDQDKESSSQPTPVAPTQPEDKEAGTETDQSEQKAETPSTPEKTVSKPTTDSRPSQSTTSTASKPSSGKPSTRPAGGAAAAAIQSATKKATQALAAQPKVTKSSVLPIGTATQTYSRVARAAAEKALPGTGEAGSVLTLLGLGLTSLGLVGRKRRKG